MYISMTKMSIGMHPNTSMNIQTCLSTWFGFTYIHFSIDIINMYISMMVICCMYLTTYLFNFNRLAGTRGLWTSIHTTWCKGYCAGTVITGKTNWQQPTKEQKEFCIRQVYLHPGLICHATITNHTVNNLVALPIIHCVNASQFSCPSKS